MPRPWEEGGTEADWASVEPENLEFVIGHAEDAPQFVVFHPAGRDGFELDEIPAEWVARWMPVWLQDQVMEATFVPTSEMSDGFLGQALESMHFWQFRPQTVQDTSRVRASVLRWFDYQARTGQLRPPGYLLVSDLRSYLAARDLVPPACSMETVQGLLEEMFRAGLLAVYTAVEGAYCLPEHAVHFREKREPVPEGPRRSLWDRLLGDDEDF